MANKKRAAGLQLLHLLTLLFIPFTEAAGFEQSWLEVRVMDRHSGDALGDAAVCVGTSADPRQFGAQRTDAGGIVRFTDLLSHSPLVTASKRGYQGTGQRVDPVSRANVVVLKIVPGGGGPRCDAPDAEDQKAAASSGLEIEGVAIRKDPQHSGQILLSLKVWGSANQVRISERADFSDVEWQELRQPLPLDLGEDQGPVQLYVQVRRHVETDGAMMETTSPVEQVRYRR